jgi:copper chaperone CopZ
LRGLNGVSEVTVDLQSGRVRVNGDPDSNALLAALQEAGYPAQTAEGAQSDKKIAGFGA